MCNELTATENDFLAETLGRADDRCELDPSDFVSELDSFDLSEDQKKELLLTLWNIMRSFVDIGFRVDVLEHILFREDENSNPREISVDYSVMTHTSNVAEGAQKADEL